MQTLEVNNKQINTVFVDNQWWIAIKPICDALEVDYNRQFQNLKLDKILNQLFAKQQMVGKDFKQREMICLPERYIYGWIFSLNSSSEILLKYKMKFYDILYNHFHSELTKRAKVLKEKTLQELELERLNEELQESETFKKIVELKKELGLKKKNLLELDKQYSTRQLEIWQKEIS